MPQRFIKVPEDVKVGIVTSNGEATEVVFTLKEFVRHLLDTNPVWGKSYKNIRSAMSIEEALENAVAGSVVSFAQDDWELLKEAVEKPQIGGPGGTSEGFGYIPQVVRQIVSFMDAVVKATDKQPE